MPAINSSLDRFTFLSDAFRELLHRRLREIAGESAARRSAWLVDLGTRLSALVAELLAAGMQTPQVHRLYLLAEELTASADLDRAQLEQIWRHCEAVLASFADPLVAADTREDFWKPGTSGEPPKPAR